MNRFIRNRRTVIALVLGFTAVPTVALAATDAVPGDPFKLGQENHIEKATTTLSGVGQTSSGVLQLRRDQGSGIGAVLKVVNEGPGAAKRGIDINVPAGQSPISVNPDAGKASGLNADRVDGRSEEDFLPSRLYGVGTGLVTGPGGGKTVLVSGVNLSCDDGDVALSAGGNAVDPEDALNGIVPFRSSYQIEFTDNGGASRFSANMICADVAKPFR